MMQWQGRVMTYNIGGGLKSFESPDQIQSKRHLNVLEALICQIKPDVLCIQELAQYIDADGINHNQMELIRENCHLVHGSFGKTLSMKDDLQVKKSVMVEGIFNDWWDWSKGNGIFARKPLARLGDVSRQGDARNIPLFIPPAYEGSRDTDPRYTLLARLKQAPYPFVANLHLTTLLGERPPGAQTQIIERAQMMRFTQIKRLLDLIKTHILDQNQILILCGDFNATAEEMCIAQLLINDCGFVRLAPKNEGATHARLPEAIDHILFYPQHRLAGYDCWIENGELSQRASDHYPVVADISIQ